MVEENLFKKNNFLKVKSVNDHRIAMACAILALSTGVKIIINGCSYLKGIDIISPPDRIEAGTYALALAATGGKLKLNSLFAFNSTSCLLYTSDAADE